MNETIRISSSYGKIVILDLQLELEGERKGGYSTVIRLYYVPEINGIQSLFGVGMFTQFAHVFQSKRPYKKIKSIENLKFKPFISLSWLLIESSKSCNSTF